MRIRTKTFVIVTTVVAFLLAAMIMTSYFLVSGRFAQLEIKETDLQVRRIQNGLKHTLENLEATVGDWAPWDDTYQFVVDLNPRYIEENLVDSTFSNLRLNFMLFFNAERKLVYSRFYPSDPEDAPIRQEVVLAAIAGYPSLQAHVDVHGRISGILNTATYPLLVASQAISTSELGGPIHGTLILGRILDGQEAARIGAVIETAFTLHNVAAPDIKAPAERVVSALKKGGRACVLPLDSRSIAGYGLVADLNGKPALILETTRERELYQYGLITWRQNALAMFIMGMSFIVLLLWLMDHFILRPLAEMAQRVTDLTQSRERTGRLDLTRPDEIGQLADRINTLLQSIDDYHDLQINTEKEHQAALLENERYLRQVLDSINCGVMVVDAQERRIVDVNATGAALFQRERRGIIGNICHRLVCRREMGNCPVIDHDQTIELSERELFRPSGESLPILKSVSVIERNGRTYLIESFLDISNLLKAQADLKRSEERYRRFFDEDITGDFITAVDGRIIDCNPAFAAMFGYETVDAIKSVNMQGFYPSDEARLQLFNRLQKEGKLERIEVEFVRRDNRPLYCIGNLSSKFDEAGALQEISGYFLDDTSRVLLEKDLRQALKMEAIGTLAGGIAHDFNNILSGIMGYTEIALQDLSLSKETARRLRQVMKAAHRAKELVQQILTFSRQSESDNRPIKLNPVIDEVVKLVRASLPATIEIYLNFQSDTTVVADPVQIQQVLLNLCSNAGHAMRDKGGSLSITVQQTTLSQVFADRYPGISPGKFVCISVKDTGDGIPSEIKDRIFDPFFTTKQKGEGTGMGLSVVHGIISKLGGAITVSSASGGTLFDIYLPSTCEAFADMPDPDLMPLANGNNESIIFIDDEDFLVDIGTQMLESLGYRVTGFTDSSEALNYVIGNPEKVDLVISDMTMPRMTGKELARRLLERLPGLPIIICTGYSEELLSESSALSLGLKGFVKKPVVIHELAGKIRGILDARSPLRPIAKATG